MPDILLDNFQDIESIHLFSHTPDLDLFGAGWTQFSTPFLAIRADDEIPGNTNLEVYSNLGDEAAAIRVAVDTDSELYATVKAGANNKGAIATLGIRAHDVSLADDHYGIHLDPDSNQVSIVKHMAGTVTVLSAVTYAGDGTLFDDIFIQVVGNSLRGSVLNQNVDIGPITDSSITNGAYVYLIGAKWQGQGNRWRSVRSTTVAQQVNVTDSAFGSDSPQQTLLRVAANDSGVATDFVTHQGALVPISENATAGDDTNLNEYTQVRLDETAVATEVPAVPFVTLAQPDNIFGADSPKVRALVPTSDTGLGNEIDSEALAPIRVNDAGTYDDVITLVSFSAIQIGDSGQGDEQHPIDVTFAVINDNGLFADAVGTFHTIPVSDQGGQSADVLLIKVTEVVVIDTATANETPIINMVTQVVDMANSAEISIAKAYSILLDQGVIAETVTGGTTLAVADQVSANELIDIITVSHVFDFSGQALEVVDVLHFDGHRETDQGFGTEAVAVSDVDVVIFEQGQADENLNGESDVFLSEPAHGTDIATSTGSLSKRVTDQGKVTEAVQMVTAHALVNDTGQAITDIFYTVAPFIVADKGQGKDAFFVYDGNQKIVNILFSLRAPRILFTLNTDEEHDQ